MRKFEQEPQKDGFSFNPDRQVGDEIVRENPYVCLSSITIGSIYYTPKDNKFWLGENSECSEAVLESRFLPYLRWKFDEFVKDKNGELVNKFPCSPENIALKREELIDDAIKKTGRADFDAIERETSPLVLLNDAKTEMKLATGTPSERMVDHLARTGK